MNTQHEVIFKKAMASSRPQAILEVASWFERLGDIAKAKVLHERAVTMTWVGRVNCWTFGAMARGTPITGTNGAVIPPGRYWQDIIGDFAKNEWYEWKKSKPEVHVSTTEEHTDDNRLFVIFTVPSNASNYGMPGVFFPTQTLGFPSIAPTDVTSSQDTVQRPTPTTSADVVAEMAKTAGSATKSFGEGLGISTGKLVLIGVGVVASALFFGRFMIPKI
jgi:hypothetical protein